MCTIHCIKFIIIETLRQAERKWATERGEVCARVNCSNAHFSCVCRQLYRLFCLETRPFETQTEKNICTKTWEQKHTNQKFTKKSITHCPRIYFRPFDSTYLYETLSIVTVLFIVAEKFLVGWTSQKGNQNERRKWKHNDVRPSKTRNTAKLTTSLFTLMHILFRSILKYCQASFCILTKLNFDWCWGWIQRWMCTIAVVSSQFYSLLFQLLLNGLVYRKYFKK